MLYVANAFSTKMLNSIPGKVTITIEDGESVVFDFWWRAGGFKSAVGHADTAAVYSHLLGTKIECNRVDLSLKVGDHLLVGELVGPRLPEGATHLPPGTAINWKLIKVEG